MTYAFQAGKPMKYPIDFQAIMQSIEVSSSLGKKQLSICSFYDGADGI